MNTPIRSGFVSFYRSAAKYEAIYLYSVAPDSYQGSSVVDGQLAFDFGTTDKIKEAVELFRKSPEKALVPVLEFEEIVAKLGLGSPAAARPRAARPASSAGRPRPTGPSEEVLREMLSLSRSGKSKEVILAVLKDKFGVNPSNPTYYNWKKKAESL